MWKKIKEFFSGENSCADRTEFLERAALLEDFAFTPTQPYFDSHPGLTGKFLLNDWVKMIDGGRIGWITGFASSDDINSETEGRPYRVYFCRFSQSGELLDHEARYCGSDELVKMRLVKDNY